MSEAQQALSDMEDEASDPEVTHEDYEVVETKTVDVDDVKYLDEVYPREKVDESAVSRYKKALDKLPPIELAKDNTLIDGYHRLRAHQAEGKDKIEAEITNLSHSREVYLAAIEANNSHGQQLIQRDKKAVAQELRLKFRLEHEEIADKIGVSTSTARSYCTGANKEIREMRRERAYDYYLDYLTCQSQQDVADRLADVDNIETTAQTIRRDLQHSDTQDRMLDPSTFEEAADLDKDEQPDWIRWGNVWRFPQLNDEYGSDWSGRIPGQIVQNLLLHYTDEYDLVVDPMAGGGTTVDVCREMGRRYAAFDVNPLDDKDIRKSDTTDGFTWEEREMDNGVAELVFIDPPYGRLMDDDYADGGVSSESVSDWVDSIRDVLRESKRVTQTGGKIALLIEPFLDESDTGEFQDLPYKCMKVAEELELEQIQRISAPMNLAHKTQRSVERAKENNVLADHNRDLLIWEVS